MEVNQNEGNSFNGNFDSEELFNDFGCEKYEQLELAVDVPKNDEKPMKIPKTLFDIQKIATSVDDLFEKTNLINFENIELDLYENPFMPQKPAVQFEDLHCEEYDKYMVPLFSEEDKTGFRGNGTIVGKYLITVAHVAQSEPDELDRTTNLSALYLPFEGKTVKVTNDDLVYDGRGYRLHDDNLDDVIVYKLTDIHSAFELNNDPIIESFEMANMWYHRENDTDMIVRPHKYLCEVISLEAKFRGHHVWKNCFTIRNHWQIINGNSGGAVFRNNKVYGIISRANSFTGIVIDARYIQERIDEYERGKQQT